MQELTTFVSNHPGLSFPILVVFILLVMIEVIRAKRNTFSLSPVRATQLINHDNAIVIDIRNNDLFRKGHIIDAHSIPLSEFKTATKKIEKYKNKPVILVCNTGMESQKIAASLIKQGYNAHTLSGGMRAWTEAQLPLIKE